MILWIIGGDFSLSDPTVCAQLTVYYCHYSFYDLSSLGPVTQITKTRTNYHTLILDRVVNVTVQ